MATEYRSFRNWDFVDCEEYYFQSDREIDDPGLNQDDVSRRQAEEFDDSDDFHKYDDTDEDDGQQNEEDKSIQDRGRFDGNIGI